MTLIVTSISNRGLVQASDSNLSNDRGATGCGQKTFALGFCPGALSLAGTYRTDSISMKTWMPAMIAEYATRESPTLQGFAHDLGNRLEAEATVDDQFGMLIHITGYVSDEQGSHPEFWFVRNYEGIDGTTGAYTNRSENFEVTEDFWNRDYHPGATAGGYMPDELGFDWRYFNGLPEGRIAYHEYLRSFYGFFRQVWKRPGWLFRGPTTIEEQAILLKLEIESIGALFAISNYAAPYVGGEPQIELIPAPADAIAL